MTTCASKVTSVFCLTLFTSLLVGCNPPQSLVTDVGKSVATLARPMGFSIGTPNCNPGTPPPPNVQAWWNALPPANHKYPFAGFELWRNSSTGCTTSRSDIYRAIWTFNMASVYNLKGLVQKAELVLLTRAMPDSAGGIETLGMVQADCPQFLGGGGSMQRFGPAAAANLPTVNPNGEFTILAATDPFPTGGNVMYTFPPKLIPGPVPGAVSPTTMVAVSGLGGSSFTTDVTGAVNSALNGGIPGMSFMLTSQFEGPLTVPVFKDHNLECKTSYDLQLRLTHL